MVIDKFGYLGCVTVYGADDWASRVVRFMDFW